MTNKEAIKILTEHNRWWRGADIPMVDIYKLGDAIDHAIEVMKGLEK